MIELLIAAAAIALSMVVEDTQNEYSVIGSQGNVISKENDEFAYLGGGYDNSSGILDDTD